MSTTDLPGPAPVDRNAVEKLEASLDTALKKVAREVSHAETLDTEQRSEIYAILKALRDETDSHRTTLKELCGGEFCREVGDA